MYLVASVNLNFVCLESTSCHEFHKQFIESDQSKTGFMTTFTIMVLDDRTFVKVKVTRDI